MTKTQDATFTIESEDKSNDKKPKIHVILANFINNLPIYTTLVRELHGF